MPVIRTIGMDGMSICATSPATKMPFAGFCSTAGIIWEREKKISPQRSLFSSSYSRSFTRFLNASSSSRNGFVKMASHQILHDLNEVAASENASIVPCILLFELKYSALTWLTSCSTRNLAGKLRCFYKGPTFAKQTLRDGVWRCGHAP